MALKLYNTLTRQKEVFKPLHGKKVGMYVCGPTVYDSGHLGHARTYIIFDIIRKYLEESGYDVKFISNVTDVHDDIIKKAQAEKTIIKKISDKYTEEFLKELKELKIKPANEYPRVSDYIPEIIKFIENLIGKGYAYEKNGSVYFDVSKFKNYGKLSRRKLEQAKSGTRVDVDKYDKEELADFALWKKSDAQDKKVEASWDSSWGPGRPGWHIECSVMSKELLGEQFDIHAGAQDLVFPHHENEIAQSEAASEKSPFVKYWMHSGLLTINGQKMSKSLSNFITIRDILKKYPFYLIRLWVISAHYRSPLDFSEDALKQVESKLARMKEVIDRIDETIIRLGYLGVLTKNNTDEDTKSLIEEFENSVKKELDDDFNTPKALATIFSFIKKIHKLIDENKIGVQGAEEVQQSLIKYINLFLGEANLRGPIQDEEILKLCSQYERARKEKDYAKSDQLREILKQKGIAVQDGPDKSVFRTIDKEKLSPR